MKLMHKLGLLAAALLLIPAVSQAKTLDELLAERGVVAKGSHGGSASGAKVWYDEGTRFGFPDAGFTMKVNAMIRTRYEYTDDDSATDETSRFDVNDARIRIEGTALNKEFSYRLETNHTDSHYETDSDVLEAHITWHACDWLWARMGKQKTGVSRQFNTMVTDMQFADRSFVSDNFFFNREEGLALGGSFDGFSWGAAAFNPRTSADNTDHLWVFNARYSHGDIDPFVEGDVNGTEDFAGSIGVAYAISEGDTGCTTCSGEDLDVWNIDLTAKYQGFSFAAEYFSGDDDVVDEDGWYAQAGYFLMPSELEFAARYQMIDNEDSTGTDETTGWDFSLNYYWWKHQLKAQVGYSMKSTDPVAGGDVDVDRFIFQLSSWF